MHSVHPLADPVLWARWLAAVAALLWLPGQLLAGRWLRGLEPAGRAVASLGAGLLLVPLLGPLLEWAGLPLTPAVYLPAALVVAGGSGLFRAHRTAVAAWSGGLEPLGRSAQAAVLAAALLTAVLVLWGHRDFVAPPHVHDAGNHAWLVARVAATGSLRAGAMFDPQTGVPAVGYLPGWHGAAALVARLSGVAPYVSAWFLPLLLLAATPVALSLLWRAWGVPVVAAPVAAFAVAVNQFVPGGVLGWGGFGQLAGFCLVPIVTLALRAALAVPSAWSGLGAGLLLAALLRVHASEALVVLGAAALAWPALPAALRRAGHGRRPRAGLFAAAALAIAAGPDVWRLAHDYAGRIPDGPRPPLAGVGPSLERWLAAGGHPFGLKALTALGLLLSWRAAPWRRLGAAALGCAALFIALASVGDPVSWWLATPFYAEAPRVLYLQLYLLPPLLALPLLHLRGALAARGGARFAGAAATALVMMALASAVPGVLRNYRHMRAAVPFGAGEYALARRLPETVGPAGLVADYWDDGGVWAMHVSGRRFLIGCSWRLFDASGRDLRETARGLLARPWPHEVRALRARGLDHVWVSDQFVPGPDAPPPARHAFDADPRFVAMDRGGEATLYRILWDGEAAPAPSEP